MGELQPVTTASSWTVCGRESFADNTFQPLRQGCGVERFTVVIGGRHLGVGAAETDSLQGFSPSGEKPWSESVSAAPTPRCLPPMTTVKRSTPQPWRRGWKVLSANDSRPHTVQDDAVVTG